jgi:hypothetical protein
MNMLKSQETKSAESKKDLGSVSLGYLVAQRRIFQAGLLASYWASHRSKRFRTKGHKGNWQCYTANVSAIIYNDWVWPPTRSVQMVHILQQCK